MDQTNTKWWLNSLTVRGGFMAGATVVTSILNILGIKIGSDEVNAIADAVAALVSAIGILLVIYGRIRAEFSLRFQK